MENTEYIENIESKTKAQVMLRNSPTSLTQTISSTIPSLSSKALA